MPNLIKYNVSAETLALKKGNFWIGTGDVPKGPTSTTGYWNGITPPAGGYTIYINKASNGPSMYAPSNDAQLIDITNKIAVANYTTVNQCFNYFASQSDKMVFNKDYDALVTNGLVFNVDASFVPSYPKNGTTWYDISSGGNNGTLVNDPTFSSSGGGSFVFDGTDDEVNTSYGPTLGDFTICIWFKDNASATYGRLVDKSYTGGFWLGRNASTPNSWGGGIKETSDPYGIFLTLTDGQWNYLTSIRSGSNHILYGNGITNTTSNTVTSSSLDSTTISIGAWSGAETSQRFKGDIGVVQVYNRALTSTEVLQNYNAGLTRFNTLNVSKNGLTLNLDSTNVVSYPTTGTSWRDLSGFGNHASGIGTPTFDSTSRTFQFDATDDRFLSTISQPFDMYCLEITFKPHKQISSNVAPDNNAYSLLGLRRNIGNNNGINVYEWTGTMTNETVSLWSHDGYATGIVTTITNEFHTMLFNWNGSTYDIWLDGVQQSTIQRSNGHAQLLTNVTFVEPGYNSGYNYYHKGNISTVRTYNRSLTSQEVIQNYYGGPIVTSGLVMALDVSNLVSYPGSGTSWRDLTTNGNNCTLTNGPTFNSSNGGSIVFDGTDDYIGGPTLATNSPLSFTNGNFTLEHWIRITSYEPSEYYGLTNMIMSKGPASTYNYATQVTNSTTLSFIHRDNSEGLIFLNFTVPTITNNITQIVFSVTLTQVSLYLNGILIETKSLTGNPITPYTNDVLLIGGLYDVSNTNFIGNMYLHRIYNRALTADEISQNYNATKSRFGL